MNFAAQMRVGSVEMVAALAVVAAVAAGGRRRAAPMMRRARSLGVRLWIRELRGAREVEARCPLTIGRASDADVTIADPEVSRAHARLELDDGVAYVRDLGSSNGTFLNGERLKEAVEVLAGDHLDVGTTRIVIQELKAWM